MKPIYWSLSAAGVLLVTPIGFSSFVLRHSEHRYLDYLSHLGATLGRSVGTFVIVYLICLVVSVAIRVRGDRVAVASEAIVSGLRSLPSIAWLGVTIGVVGVNGALSTFSFIFLGSFPLILSHMLHGLGRCPPEKSFVAELSGATPFVRLRFVALPAASTEFAQAARYGMNVTFLLAIIHDLVLRPNWGISGILDLASIGVNRWQDHLLLTIIIAAAGVGLDQLSVAARGVVRLRGIRRVWSS